VTINPNFEITQLSALDFNDAEVIDVSANRSYGRRFKVKVGDIESKEYVLSDLFKRAQELSINKESAYEKSANLNSLKKFLKTLKTADALAEVTYSQREYWWYRFRTEFHRIFNFGSHSEKIKALKTQIKNEIALSNKALDDIEIINDAVKCRNIDAIKQFALAGTNFNVSGRDGKTILNNAILYGNIEIVKALIDKGADCNFSDVDGKTPLMCAIIFRKEEIVKFFLKNERLEINQVDKEGETALIKAVIHPSKEMVELLLANEKLEINRQNNEGMTALSYAALLKQKDILRLLLKHEKIEIGNEVICAVISECTEIVELFLEIESLNINHQDREGLTALNNATSNLKYLECVELILRCENIDINLADNDGITPLMRALILGKTEVVKLLLAEEKIEVNYQDKKGRTALNYAIANSNYIELIEILLQCKKIDINLPDNDGLTPLMRALSYNNEEGFKLLLAEEKIEVNHKDKKGLATLIYAISFDQKDMLELLLNDERVDVNLQNGFGQTALSYAIHYDHKDSLELLLRHEKININLQDNKGRTGLMLALMLGRNEILEILKKAILPNDLLKQKEMMKIKMLAHSANLGGSIQLQSLGEKTYDLLHLEGSYSFYFLKKMSKSTKHFSQFHIEAIKDNELLKLLDLFETGLNPSEVRTIERIEKGLPVFLSTGFLEHSVFVILNGPYFILCNRGAAMREVVEVFQYDPQKLTMDVLKKINEVKSLKIEDYKKLFFEELPATLGFKPKGLFELELEELCAQSLPVQTIGNCAWASPEAGVFIFFALSTLLDDKGVHASSWIRRTQAREINNKFNKWLSFTQNYQLELYLDQRVIRIENEKIARPKVLDIDYSVLIRSIKSILSTASKAPNRDESLNILKTILTKTLSSKSSGDIKAAEDILDSIGTITSDEMKLKFEQVL
jgi:ankyrin repeat protein